MTEQTTTMAPALAWHIKLYPLNGSKPSVVSLTQGGRSLHFCRMTLNNWRNSFADDGKTEAAIEPMAGWAAVSDDAVLAICVAIGAGDLAPELGAARIRALMEVGNGRNDP